MLHLEQKGVASTGRFGLGFKSVYLVTDRPRITVPLLSFEIVGGLLPRWLERENEGIEPGTAIDLRLRKEVAPSVVLRDFLDYGGLLAAFAQTIRRIEFNAGTPVGSEFIPQKSSRSA